ncbi:MAG TPA: hypothetical protein VFX06_16005 [Stellaceae bacterium]|nr:hypothetical protein [Stellaceae bacterium]
MDRPAEINIGYTITHVQVATDADAACAARGKGAAVSGQDALIAHYNDPQVRGAAIDDLGDLRRAGASVVRTVFWVSQAADVSLNKSASPRGPLARMIARNGILPEQYPKNLARFAADVQQAGYKLLVVVFGNQGRSAPHCRSAGRWGECYDPAYDARTWSAMAEMIRAVKTESLPRLRVVFDIAGEYCFANKPKMLVERNAEHYVRYMTARYHETFGDHNYIVSCLAGAHQAALAEAAIPYSAAFLSRLSPKPAFFDLHVYLNSPAPIEQVLVAADAAARRLGVPLIIGETFANNVVLFDVIKHMRAANRLDSLQDILVWPLRMGSKCSIDLKPTGVLNWVLPAFPQP